MTETEFGITKATHLLPARNLLRVPHKNGVLIVSSPAFGPSTYTANLDEMSRQYSHSTDIPELSFREPTTSESISASAYKFGEIAKPQIFDKNWLQAGGIVRAAEGVFFNTKETDEEELKSLLDNCKQVNGIYLGDNDFAFAPYETFQTEVQDSGDFAEGGLARALEHTSEKIAPSLRELSSTKHYKRGVNVWGFDPVSEPIQRVATLDSYGDFDGDRLDVDGYWGGNDGCVFGVLNSGEASAKK